MRKLVLFIILLLVITIAFLLIVLVVNRESGKGALQVTSIPESQVFLDNEFFGKTPLCLCELPQLLDSGEYTIKLIPLEKDLKQSEQKITIYQGVLTVVDKTFDINNSATSGSIITLSPIENNNKSELMVISFPGNAQIVLDSEIVGKTPFLLEDITISDHELKIIKDGYREKILKVKTIEGKRLEANITMGIKTEDNEIEDEGETLSVSKVLILDTPTGFLRVRQEGSVGSPQIDSVNPGQKFDLISRNDDWYEIKLNENNSGWISATYAKIED